MTKELEEFHPENGDVNEVIEETSVRGLILHFFGRNLEHNMTLVYIYYKCYSWLCINKTSLDIVESGRRKMLLGGRSTTARHNHPSTVHQNVSINSN